MRFAVSVWGVTSVSAGVRYVGNWRVVRHRPSDGKIDYVVCYDPLQTQKKLHHFLAPSPFAPYHNRIRSWLRSVCALCIAALVSDLWRSVLNGRCASDPAAVEQPDVVLRRRRKHGHPLHHHRQAPPERGTGAFQLPGTRAFREFLHVSCKSEHKAPSHVL